MALPTTIDSGVGLAGHHPPFKSNGGAFYGVVRTDADELDVHKATNPTSSWAVQDAGDGPVHAGTILGFATIQDGDVIHMIAWSAASYEYYTFNMATDQWVVDQLMETPTDAPDKPWASIARRSIPAATVVVYSGDTDKSMGDSKERVDVNIRPDSSGTWSGPTALDAGGDLHYAMPACILGTSDSTHCYWLKETSVANDPPVQFRRVEGRTLDSADALSTVDESDVGFGTQFINSGATNCVFYDDGTDKRIIFAVYEGDSAKARNYHNATEDGSGDLIFGSDSLRDTSGVDLKGINSQTHCPHSIAELNGELHHLFSGGGDFGVDQDLYHTTSNDDGATWAESEEIDAITVNFISANIYVRGSRTVMAYVYDDDGVQKYDEKLLLNTPPNFFQQPKIGARYY